MAMHSKHRLDNFLDTVNQVRHLNISGVWLSAVITEVPNIGEMLNEAPSWYINYALCL
jgi:hypothetical protein